MRRPGCHGQKTRQTRYCSVVKLLNSAIARCNKCYTCACTRIVISSRSVFSIQSSALLATARHASERSYDTPPASRRAPPRQGTLCFRSRLLQALRSATRDSFGLTCCCWLETPVSPLSSGPKCCPEPRGMLFAAFCPARLSPQGDRRSTPPLHLLLRRATKRGSGRVERHACGTHRTTARRQKPSIRSIILQLLQIHQL